MSALPLHERARDLELPARDTAWTADDVILYHLGIGAGSPSTDAGELEYVYEGNLKVLPSFTVIPTTPSLAGLFMSPELGIDLTKALHGEQEIEIDRPLPPKVKGLVTTARIADVFDKGKAAVVVFETETRDAAGERLFLNRSKIFIRDAGGFGGDPGPSGSIETPEREPDLVVERTTEDRQALLYRLNGDKNPLHADPAFAQRSGFDRPILHGLCTYGIVCKAVVDELLDGDVGRVATYSTRFAGVVFPGETLTIQLWREPGRIALRALVAARESVVLTNAEIRIREENQ